MLKLRKQSLTTAAGAVLAIGIGMSSHALAVPVFTFNPSGIPGTVKPAFNADFNTGTSSDLLTTIGNTHTGLGYIHFTGFNLAGSPIFSSTSGLGSTYGMYLTFTLADQYVSGGTGIDTVNSVNQLTQLDFKWFADPGLNDVFTPASALTATDPKVADVGGDDILLASGGLTVGVSGFDSLGGAFLNSQNTFTLTPQGSLVFVNPVPFYNIAFTENNNTSAGLERLGNITSINQTTSGVDFQKVPEPASLALIGIGLLALVGCNRRRRY
jgi:hypothetical protein